MSVLQVTWFWLLTFVLVVFTLLSGFDLGLGMLLSRARDERTRQTLFAAIGPFWDSNEVWLIALGGLLFAVFPPVYAAVFSGFYLFIMLLLFALIMRAVAIDFGAKSHTPKSRAYWSVAVAASSTLAVLLLGVTFGNLLRGIPLDAGGTFTGTPQSLLNSFAVLVGVLNLAMIATHGALYLGMKAEGEVIERARTWARATWTLYFTLLVVTVLLATVALPHLLRNYRQFPALWLLPTLGMAAVFATGIANELRRRRLAFFLSSIAITVLLGAAAVALFPLLVPAQGNPAASLTVGNASSSPLALQAMLIITLIGMPLVLIYITWVYRIFGGKLKEEAHY